MSRGLAMADDGFREFLRELTEPLGGVTFRKMFGGLSIYQDGMVFALGSKPNQPID